MPIAIGGISSSCGFVYSLIVASPNNALAVWCLISTQCITSKLNFDSWKGYWAIWVIKSAKLRIYLSASWSIRMVNWWPSKYGREKRKAPTIAMHSRWASSNRSLPVVRELERYLIGLFVSFRCFCNNTELICTLHASASTKMFPPELSSVRSGEDIIASLFESMVERSLHLHEIKDGSWSPFRPLLSQAAIQAKLVTIRRKMLHNPRTERGFV